MVKTPLPEADSTAQAVVGPLRDSFLRARAAVAVALHRRLKVSRTASEIERKLNDASAGEGGWFRRGEVDGDGRLLEARALVREAERAFEDAKEAAEREFRWHREAHAEISAARSARRRKAEAEWQRKYAPKAVTHRESPMFRCTAERMQRNDPGIPSHLSDEAAAQWHRERYAARQAAQVRARSTAELRAIKSTLERSLGLDGDLEEDDEDA